MLFEPLLCWPNPKSILHLRNQVLYNTTHSFLVLWISITRTTTRQIMLHLDWAGNTGDSSDFFFEIKWNGIEGDVFSYNLVLLQQLVNRKDEIMKTHKKKFLCAWERGGCWEINKFPR